ncbi:hypothetical protein [Streptomyces sp. NPDC059489]|uniref:hypothetical protein n=1 Tax=Streptomyces sp. NPDC059489 TaxID=3346849 RepID=UPI0036A4B624
MSSERTYGPRELPEDRPGSDQAASPAAELSDVLLVVATMTATPFLQAISTYFGNALAKGMGSGTREIMHRFTRRQARASLDDPADVVDLIHLRTEDGWLVEMKVAVEPEALAQLPELCAADAPLSESDRRPGTTATIRWDQDGYWIAATVREDGYRVAFTWDPEVKQWREHTYRRPIPVT